MADDKRRSRVVALLTDSVDLYAAVAAVCRALPEDRAFIAGVLELDTATFDDIDRRWREKLKREPALDVAYQTQTREYEWSFRQLQAGATPVVEG